MNLRKAAKTRISVIVDASGSMGSMKHEVETGFDAFVKEQRAIPGKTRWALTTFEGTGSISHYTDVKGRDVQPLANYYRLGGMTPLLDAVGGELRRLLRNPGTPTVVVVFTDGMENNSREYKRDDVKALIKQAEALDWQFIFLGAGLDAFSEAHGYGFQAATTVSGTSAMDLYFVASDTATSYRTMGEVLTANLDTDEPANT